MVVARRTRSAPRSPARGGAVDNTHIRVLFTYRDVGELHNYPLTSLVGNIFKRDSSKRFFRVDPDGCFVWLGWRDADGYGGVSYMGKTVRVHRLVYSECVGPLLPEDVVRHTCDNPACIRPNHLLKGTQEDNIADKVSRGRQARLETHPGAKLCIADVRGIKKGLAEGGRNQSALGRKYGVTQSAIWCIAKGLTWGGV